MIECAEIERLRVPLDSISTHDCGQIWPQRRRFLSGILGGRMTAIAVDYSTSGFAIAADGKAQPQAEFPTEDITQLKGSDSAQKIFKIQNRRRVMAYALTGTAFSEDLKFSLAAKAKRSAESLSTVNFDDPRAYIRRFMTPIQEAFGLAQKKRQFKTFPTEEPAAIEGGQYQIARIFFAGYFDSEPFIGIGTIAHLDQVIQPVSSDVFTPTAGSLPLVVGSVTVARRMFEARDPDFAQFTVLPRRNGSLDEAVLRAKGCVDAQCSNEAAAIDQFCKELVGGRVHVATVTRDGFAWRIKPLPASVRQDLRGRI